MLLFNAQTAAKAIARWWKSPPEWSQLDDRTFYVASSRFNRMYTVRCKWIDGEVHVDCTCQAVVLCYHVVVPAMIFRSTVKDVVVPRKTDGPLVGATQLSKEHVGGVRI